MAQTPMICQTYTAGHIFALPEPKPCPSTELTNEGPIVVTYQLFKQNIIEYETDAWLCRATKQTVSLLTYFLGVEKLEEFNTEEVMVDPTTCKAMAKEKSSPEGPMVETPTGLWTTGKDLEYTTPGGGLLQCCRWYRYEVTNYYLVPATVYKRHDLPGFRSTAADVSHCDDYLDGECQLFNQTLIWKPQMKTRCQFIPFTILNGTKTGNMWISEDEQLALTTMNNESFTDCDHTLHMTDQGIPYQVLASISRLKRQTQNYPTCAETSRLTLEEYIKLEPTDKRRPYDCRTPEEHCRARFTREPKESGPIDSPLLAAWTQAVTDRMTKMTNLAFKQTWMSICRDMKTTASLLRTSILAEPIEAARTLLGDQLLSARAGNGFLEVWKCMAINTTNVSMVRQENDCTKEIPITFYMTDGIPHIGYLDPKTLIISHRGEPVDCAKVPSMPIQLEGKLMTYIRKTGKLVDVGNSTQLQILHYADDAYTSLLKPHIYTPIASYSWTELMPGVDTNALLKTSAAQAEILELLTGPLYTSTGHKHTTAEASSFASRLVAKGLQTVKGLFTSPFHGWVFLTCSVLNLWCCYQVYKSFPSRTKLQRWTASRRTQYRTWRYGRNGSAQRGDLEARQDPEDLQMGFSETSPLRQQADAQLVIHDNEEETPTVSERDHCAEAPCVCRIGQEGSM
jgi:hypothetical protein